jgi:hypothetical protein
MQFLTDEGFWGIVIGAAITLGVSWISYKNAADDLRSEAAALRKQTLLIMNFLDNRHAEPKFVRDPVTGEPTSVLVHLTGRSEARSSVSGSAQVTRAGGTMERPTSMS